MNELTRKIKITMLEKRISIHDLASETGLSKGSVNNLIRGQAHSRTAREKITNLCGVQLWPDIPVTKRRIILPAGLEIELHSEAEAIGAEEGFYGFIKRSGRKISFIKPTPALIGHRASVPDNDANLSVRDRPKSGCP